MYVYYSIKILVTPKDKRSIEIELQRPWQHLAKKNAVITEQLDLNEHANQI